MADEPKNLDRRTLTFAQAEGVEPLPQPLKLGEISQELRALLWKVFYHSLLKAEKSSVLGDVHPWVGDRWHSILRDKHVHFDHRMADDFENDFTTCSAAMRAIFENGNYVQVFDFIQFVLRHRSCPHDLADGVAWALKQSRAAYVLVDRHTIYPIPSKEEGAAIERAFADLASVEFGGARAHLRKAGEFLNQGHYADSVRESIHGVESVARLLDPKASRTLGPALAALEAKGTIHGALKAGFSSIYGYSSDESGIRHSLLDGDKAQVDLHDSMFMIGACASFVSYLIGKARAIGLKLSD
jgi:hypothetical protein